MKAKFILLITGLVAMGCASAPKADPDTAQYFSQLREQMRQAWKDQVKKKITEIKSEGLDVSFPDNNELTTSMIFEIDHSGKVLNSKIEKSSGVKLADDAALETIKEIPALIPPPTKYYGDKDTVAVRWDFTIDK